MNIFHHCKYQLRQNSTMKGANDSRAIMFAIHATHVTNNPTIRTTNICIAITYSRLTWPVLINHNYKTPTRIVKSHKYTFAALIGRSVARERIITERFPVSTLINQLSILYFRRGCRIDFDPLKSVVEKRISRRDTVFRDSNDAWNIGLRVHRNLSTARVLWVFVHAALAQCVNSGFEFLQRQLLARKADFFNAIHTPL